MINALLLTDSRQLIHAFSANYHIHSELGSLVIVQDVPSIETKVDLLLIDLESQHLELDSIISLWQNASTPPLIVGVGDQDICEEFDYILDRSIVLIDGRVLLGDLITVIERARTYQKKQHRKLEKLLVANTTECKAILENFDYLVSFARSEAREAIKARETFFANISHELKTPLSAVVGYSELVTENTLPPAEIANALQIINRNGQYLLHLLENLLLFSKVGDNTTSIKRERFNLVTLLKEIEWNLRLQAQAKKLAFSVHYVMPFPQMVKTDPIRLKQILLNLGQNAIKFTPRGSVRIRCTYHETSKELIFDVFDSGVGISKEKIEAIFNPFQQADWSVERNFGGIGLGLAISRKLANLLDGDITCVSQNGRGSIFRLKILVDITDEDFLDSTSCENLTEIVYKKSQKEKQLKFKGVILIVDDATDILLYATTLFKELGFEVITATNGIQALNCLSTNVVDMVMMDIQLPEISGYDVVRKIREKGMTVPVIGFSAGTSGNEIAKALDAGCDDFIGKPIDRTKLNYILERYCQKWIPKQSLDFDQEDSDFSFDMLEGTPEGDEIKCLLFEYLRQVKADLNNFLKQVNVPLEQLTKIAHRLKSSGLYGYYVLSSTATDLEVALKNNDTNGITECIHGILEEIDDALKFSKK
jgi:signal transduction histidine kinase/CheY-like chemotaxis protein